MVRGFIAGVIGGSATVALAAGAVSLAAGLPEGAMLRLPNDGEARLVQSAPRLDGTVRGRVPIGAEPQPDRAPEPDEGTAPSAEVVAADEAAQADAAQAPAVGGDQPGRRPRPETDVAVMSPSGTVPSAPEMRDRDAPAETQPPAMPQADTAPSALPEAPADALLAPALVTATDDGPEMPRGQAEIPGFVTVEPDEAPAQPPVPPLPEIETPLTDEGESQGQGPSDDVISSEPQGDRVQVEARSAEDDDGPQPAADRPAIGEPASVLADRRQPTSESRLPRIDGEPGATAAGDRASPLTAHAADVDVAPDLPRMAVVLIDDGRGPLGPEALQAFPFPISFAIDPSRPDAAQAAQAYRDLGFDVLALADLPDGASPQDVEVTLAGALDAVPQAVAVLEAPGGGLQVGAEVAAQVASFLSSSGHGLVGAPNGLNTAQQIAARDGVASTTFFRDFDSEGQDARVIRRFLDQGAFRARQEGAVVMLGRLRADTISALVLWGLQDRAQSVALVPVSVVLRETQDAE